MANIPIWPGSSSFAAVSASYYNTPPTGSSPTPFGFYDNDTEFQSDADKVANFCARRLGYPIENVELQDLNFWTAFEEATTVLVFRFSNFNSSVQDYDLDVWAQQNGITGSNLEIKRVFYQGVPASATYYYGGGIGLGAGWGGFLVL
jgi:hypothetical protein